MKLAKADLKDTLRNVFVKIKLSAHLADTLVESLWRDPVPPLPEPDGLRDGGEVIWLSGLTYFIKAAFYWLLGLKLRSPDTEITIDPADPDYGRLDAFVLDANEKVIVLKGTPSENPQLPSVDPSKYIYLTFAYIPAGATEPGGITTNIIFDEHVASEFTTSASGVAVNWDYLVNPFSGLKCADVGAIGTGDRLMFVSIEPKNVADFETLSMFVKLKAQTTKQHFMFAEFFLAGALVSNSAIVFSASVVTDWQSFVLKFADFIFTGTQFDAVSLRWSKSGSQADHPGFYLDLMKLEAGVSQPPVVKDGKDGANWHSGTYHDPLVIGAKVGDFFLDTGTIIGDIYKCTALPETWAWQMNAAPRIHPYSGNWIVNNVDTGLKAKGEDGDDGYTPQKGVDYFDGEDGEDGYTPQKNIDYFDGLTPFIGANGNWVIGQMDTGVKAVGADGKQVEMRNDGTNIQWRLTDGVWANLIAVSALKGADGKEVEMRENAGWVQWRLVGDGNWINLYQIPTGSGTGLPPGGTTGQVLKKLSNADGDAGWANESGGAGGSVPPDLHLDFEEAGDEFIYNVPYAMKFTSLVCEGTPATLSHALNTNLPRYTKLTVTANAAGLVSLYGQYL